MPAPEQQSQQLSLALKGAKSGIWDWHIPEEILFFGPNYYRLAGYEPDEFPHKFAEWEKRVHPDDITVAKKTIQQYLAGELDHYTVEFRFKTKSGSWMWILGQGEITERDEAGDPTRFVGLHVDISQRKKTEQAFLEERSFTTSLIDTAQMIVLILDIEGRIRRINPYMEGITGYQQSEVKGKDWFDTFLPPADHTEIRAVFKKAVNNIEIKGLINPIVAKDGREIMVEWYNKTLKDADGSIIGVLSLGVDITERQKAEEKLQKSETKFRVLLNNQDDAIFLHEVIPDGFANFSEVNDKAVERYGYSRKELLQLNAKDITRPEDTLKNLQSTARQQLVNRGHASFEVTHIKKSGKEFPVEVNSTLIELDNRTYILSTVRDITERKQAEQDRLELEEQLRQKHKMEAVGYMAGGMAHNFNNNLGIILGNVELSQLKVQDPKVQKLLKNAKIAILRSRDLVSQIITYSRKGIQNKAPMQLLTIIDETITLLSSTLPTTVKLQKIISPDCNSEFIYADASQIQEILVNLCNNAVHAMNEKGELTIALEPVELSQADIPAQYDGIPGKYAKLSVQDSGCGMPAEMVDKIFDPFFSTKEMHEGTGMGLATVQGIVAQHGGIIKVNSIPDQGTVFNLYFPIVEKTATTPTPRDKSMPKGTEKILFVDDDEMLAKLGKLTLSEMGYQVVTMTESTEALKLFAANPDHFDLVITDQTMPELCGKDLIQELKKIRPDLRTILCTGFSSKIDADRAKQQGIDAFCMKPLDLPEMLQTVRRVLDAKKI
ncbi:MAG: PAS domain S-box protein [Desulfuromusa sp.]